MTEPRPYSTPLAYLRAFVIVLVVAHHAAMGYQQILPETTASSLAEHLETMRAISPINDEQRSGLLSLFSAFNDHFFMSLLFLLSGLFVWRSLQGKGKAHFLRDRLIRLGVPLAAMVVLRPLTYYPTYLQVGGNGGLADFWQQWSAIAWRGGPIWFLEVLLAFNIVVVLVAAFLPGTSDASTKSRSQLAARPLRCFVILVVLSAVAYIPVTTAYGSFFWLQVGPAQIQINRLFLYGVYFLVGLVLGAHGLDRTFLVPDSTLTRRWAIWTAAALIAFVASLVVAVGGGNELLTGFLYVLASATLSFAFMALFLRFGQRRRSAFDSLSDNSYGIYVIHYGIVSWLSLPLLGVPLPAAAKWSILFPAALLLCWGATALLRRVPGVARVI